MPPRDGQGRTLWVTRAPQGGPYRLPLADPALCRPRRVFLFVSPSEVAGVAERFGATPFDVEGVFWSHRGRFAPSM